MYQLFAGRTAGFTMVELLVVIGIIGLLLAVIFPSFSDARKQARDDRRVADIAQLQLALKLYQQQSGRYPDDSTTQDGARGAELEALLSPYLAVPTDPRDNGSNDFYYYYDSDVRCADINDDGTIDSDDDGQVVLFAKTMESNVSTDTWDDICECQSNCSVDGGLPASGTGYVKLLSS